MSSDKTNTPNNNLDNRIKNIKDWKEESREIILNFVNEGSTVATGQLNSTPNSFVVTTLPLTVFYRVIFKRINQSVTKIAKNEVSRFIDSSPLTQGELENSEGAAQLMNKTRKLLKTPLDVNTSADALNSLDGVWYNRLINTSLNEYEYLNPPTLLI